MTKPMSDERLAEIRIVRDLTPVSLEAREALTELLAEVGRLRGELTRQPRDILGTLYPAAEAFTAAEARRRAAYEAEQVAVPQCICGCPLGQRCTCDDSADHGDPREADGEAD